jgi:hypothetical protein
MLTKEEARAALEAELFALKLTKPMALPENWAFCESAHRYSWQALWLRRS